mgnify:CR=1 FL=1
MNKLNVFLITAAAVVSSFNTQASDIEKVFNTLSIKADSPTIANGQRANSINLGSVRYRPEMHPETQLFDFRPPSINAGGCGSFDFFAGSFSLISKDELVQMGRSIAQGVPSYAFQLAVSSICPECSEAMKGLSEKLEEFNKMTLDGCKVAQNIIGDDPSWAKGLGEATNWLAAPLQTVNGTVDDLADSMSETDKSAEDKINDDGLADEAQLEGNVIWNIIKELELDEALATVTNLSEDKAAHIYLNLLGTIVQNYKSESERGADERGLGKTIFTSKLRLKDFYDENVQESTKTVWQCDDTIKCMNPTESATYFSDDTLFSGGFVKRIKNQLYNGTSTDTIFMKASLGTLCTTVTLENASSAAASCDSARILEMSQYNVLFLIEYLTKNTIKEGTKIHIKHGPTLEKLAELVARDIALGMIESLSHHLTIMAKEILAKDTAKMGMKLLANDVAKLVNDYKTENKDELKVLKEQLDKEDNFLESQINALNRIIEQRQHARKTKLENL